MPSYVNLELKSILPPSKGRAASKSRPPYSQVSSFLLPAGGWNVSIFGIPDKAPEYLSTGLFAHENA